MSSIKNNECKAGTSQATIHFGEPEKFLRKKQVTFLIFPRNSCSDIYTLKKTVFHTFQIFELSFKLFFSCEYP